MTCWVCCDQAQREELSMMYDEIEVLEGPATLTLILTPRLTLTRIPGLFPPLTLILTRRLT